MRDFDIIVIGGGHAGIEAAAISARFGLSVALVSMARDKIGLMSCNPAIGGLAKGQLVREIDALGGQMAHIIDATGIHFKMLNKSKGPAVWSPRAQADRKRYAQKAQEILAGIKNLTVIEDLVDDLQISQGKVEAVHLQSGRTLSTYAVILTAGTFLNGLIHIGLNHFPSGRAGERSAPGITETLVKNGLKSGRLKTGTPPRLHRDSIDLQQFEIQHPDNPALPFSFSTRKISQHQIPCYIGYTTKQTHTILRTGFKSSPMFTGRIKAAGPRYCPSIEDKINRFADRSRHQLFLEPEGYEDPEM
jgi:tRNA uridine 5-carboxymethylaminomethyl modification enzyme